MICPHCFEPESNENVGCAVCEPELFPGHQVDGPTPEDVEDTSVGPLVEVRRVLWGAETWWSVDVGGDGLGEVQEVPGGWQLRDGGGKIYSTLDAAVRALCGPLYGLDTPAPASALAPLRAALQQAYECAQASTRDAQRLGARQKLDHAAGHAAGLAHALRLLDAHEREQA